MQLFPVSEHVKYEGFAGSRGPSPGLWGRLKSSAVRSFGFYSGDDLIHASPALSAGAGGWQGPEGFWYKVFGTAGASPVTGSIVAPVDNAVPAGEIKFTLPVDATECYVTLDDAKTGAFAVAKAGLMEFVFEARVKFSHVLSGTDALAKAVGLRAPGGAATGSIGATGELASNSFIGFRAVNASADRLDAVYASTGGVAVHLQGNSADGMILSADTYVKLGLRFDGKKLYYFVNGNQVGAGVLTTATNFPVGKPLVPFIGARSAGSTSKNFTIDWLAFGRVE
ncbi:MAG: hypothetical protein KatS3mg087_1133 [Patescibacteria group bacterium]|nr:MAG: hypothetical protein KatS3mg087_1133 [Patescibacteria group bacterium]